MVDEMEVEAEKLSRLIRKKWPRRNDFLGRILKAPKMCFVKDEDKPPISFHFTTETTVSD
jgi:hypothetical protein